MLDFMPPNSIFVVDTSEYAGDFEKDLCYFLTGRVDACDKPDFVFDNECHTIAEYLDAQLAYIAGDYQVPCPSTLYTTPGMFDSGLGQGFDVRESLQIVLEKYQKERKEMLEFLIAQEENDSSLSDIHSQELIAYYKKCIAEVEAMTVPNHFRFYGSVAIFLNDPTEEVIEFLKKRATRFCYEKGIHIRGFRLLTFKLEVRDLPND